ncbi:hypothetical protein [Chelativorans sp. J32]|jgi:hypothetical protein|uniref:hypothetical protein n=1 Tax=Chelativorans sp. J32 TaxID=935840 RepID=UPI00048959BD|nr:hypothetical protein [Chelativorans sp. J32]
MSSSWDKQFRSTSRAIHPARHAARHGAAREKFGSKKTDLQEGLEEKLALAMGECQNAVDISASPAATPS